MISEKKVRAGLRGISLIQNAITIEYLGMQLIAGEVIALAISSGGHFVAKHFIWKREGRYERAFLSSSSLSTFYSSASIQQQSQQSSQAAILQFLVKINSSLCCWY